MCISIERYRPFKNWLKRLRFWIIFIIIGLLIDEYIKEGYLFKIEDILVIFSHENIIVILLIILIILFLLK